MKITHDILIKAGIAPWDVNKFRALWPDGCEITGKNVALADRSGLNAEALLAAVATPDQYKAWRETRPPWSPLEAEIKEAQKRLDALLSEEPKLRERLQHEHLARWIVNALGEIP